MKPPIALALEASPEISNKDLCTLVEANSSAFKPLLVIETREIFCKEVDQSYG
jgi:hypothetical protein